MTRKTTQTEVIKIFKKNSLKPLDTYVNSSTPLKTECLICGNIIFSRLDKVNSFGHRCGYCSGLKDADKKAEAFVKRLGHTPLEPYRSALKNWKMQCGGCGNIISPRYNSLQQGAWGCKFCGHKKAGAKRREIGSKKAVAMMRKAGCEPLEPYPGSHVAWKSRCMKCDALVQPRLGGIQSGQGGCKKCGIVSSAQTRMYTPREAEKIALRNKLKPLESYKGANKKWKCKCLRCGKVSSPYFQAIRDGKYGCLWCAKRIVNPSEARKKMLKAKLEPLVAYPGSDIGWLCRCIKCNREVTPAYGSIREGQGGCKWCKSKSPQVDPSTALQLMITNNIQPLEPFKTSHAKWKSRCLRCENHIAPSYHDIRQGGSGCKYCAPNFVNEKRIFEVMANVGLEPLSKYVNSKEPWRVKHKKCGRIFTIEYANVRGGSSCRYCAGNAVIPKEATQLMQKMGLQPLVPYPGGKKPWKCKCKVCKKIIYPNYSSTANRNAGCAYCVGNKVDAKDAVALMKSNNLTPLIPYPGARVAWKCRCRTCKNIVSPQYSSVKGGGGCRFCADWGIDYLAEGFIYLLTNKKFNAHKIGIGNTKRAKGGRIRQHKASGWELFNQIDFELTEEAFQIEQKVLIWLRKTKGLQVYLSEFEMPQGGYTETVDASEIELPTIWAKVEELSRVKR
jgi:hypothetical protein